MRRSQETHQLKTMPRNVHRHERPPPPPQKSLQIKQEDKFFSKLLSRESSRVNSSSRVFYYGGAPRAVPFQWESQPGTPIRDFATSSHAASSFPPLTPPPSYYSKLKSRRFMQSKNVDGRSKPKKVSTMSNMFSKINHSTKKPRQVSQSPSVSSTSSSSTWSMTSFSSPSVASASSSMESKFNRRDLSGARSSLVHFGLEDAKDDGNNEEEG
ncbi:YLP motif-containing protein 1-like, partial [Rhodamnia argentea]|uniref:YLP motif-containing protein 1-like n=1 Tax=Rhodamnia argentea TaxID=178133 RepID=A0A8B8Q082_9MYRT